MEETITKANKVVGTKQTLKAIKNKKVDKILIAEDTDEYLINKIITACKEHETPYEYVTGKEELGKMCGIERQAATVAILAE
jgi:large subunit ribosomal protein L7A